MDKKRLNKYYENMMDYYSYVKNELSMGTSKEKLIKENKKYQEYLEMEKNSEKVKEECFNHYLDLANSYEDEKDERIILLDRYGDVFVNSDNVYGKREDVIKYFENELKKVDEYFEDEEEKEFYKNGLKETIEELKKSNEKIVVLGIYEMDEQFHILNTEDELYELISIAKELQDDVDETLEKDELHILSKEEHYFRIDLEDNSSCYVGMFGDIESIARQDVVNEALNDSLITEGEMDNIAEISAIAKTEFVCMQEHNRNYPCSSYKSLLNRILGDCNVGINSKNKIDENTKDLDKKENITSIELNGTKLYILGLGNEQFYVTKNSNEIFNKAQLMEKMEHEKANENEEEEEF